MELTPSQKKTVQHQFDSYCKKILKCECKDYFRHISWRAEHEVSFSELSEEFLEQLYMHDNYPAEYCCFQVQNYAVEIKDENLALALQMLPEDKREIVLLAYFLDMTDQEIANQLQAVRRTVQYKRANSLKEIKKRMEGIQNENNTES